MHLQNMMVKSRFFESIDSYPHLSDWHDVVAARLGPGWSLHRWSFWLQAMPDGETLPAQGFKLHVSPDLTRLGQQVAAVVEVLARERAGFKFVADRHLLEMMNSKNFARTASAKFFTVYPRDHDHFLALAAGLREAMAGYDGPYILTDRRVPRSRVVFYRYGGLTSVKSQGADGEVAHMIQSPDGEAVEDKREPMFQLPEWVADPFEREHEPEPQDDSPYLGGRFEVKEAIYFSNSGGIYTAVDRETGDTVVLKEARPHAGWRGAEGSYIAAPEAVSHEYSILSLLEPLNIAPRPYALFKEWEHTFLAEEYLDWPTWMQYFVREEIFLGPFVRGTCPVLPFLRALVPVTRNAIALIRSGHEHGVMFGDVSPNNFLIEVETHQVKVIDVESVVAVDERSSWQTLWATQGFENPERKRRGALAPEDDWYALGKCVLSAIMPLQGLTAMGILSDRELAQRLVYESGLPGDVYDLIDALLRADPDAATAICERLAEQLEGPPQELKLQRAPLAAPRPQPLRLADDPQAPQRIADFILASYRGLSANEVWPGDPSLYETGKWNLAYGATGVALFLEAAGRELPAELTAALADERLLGEQVREIGLYSGLAGIAAYHGLHGRTGIAGALLQRAAASPLRYRSANLFAGEAGLGLAALSLHGNGAGGALALAADCAGYLHRTAIEGEHGVHWKTGAQAERVQYGYLRGIAGIAWFLSEYARAGDCARSRELSRLAIDYVLAHAVTDAKGRLQWGVDIKDMRLMPYWSNGAAGMGGVLLRMGVLDQRPDYLAVACDLAHSAFSKLSVNVGQLDGLAGIADFLHDLWLVTGEARFRHQLDEVLQGIALFATRTDEGLAFPGALSQRLSCDFATGSAGVGLCLLRARSGGARVLHDFALPSVALFGAAVSGAGPTATDALGAGALDADTYAAGEAA
ncbi:class III lanthionine synthetase LanKC [Lysobacter yananisis]|uniref:Class III lanthionine synthetase LanKC n=1 Tax=Lysobacter yananisis TaxID=1003114 RepID=A0ABY9PFH5_9GAMM|nr:class III lanthionine synthetase LanKC [Lysobacter yananisis]WMT05520.1 class III lanthionine synthetase LanKC [Lysobacter yananisis]